MRIDAVIPARGGSKRLPGKNLAMLGELPLIAHSIRFAFQHPFVRNVYVSTDSDDIATAAAHHGARVIRRPAALATDHATTSAVIHHALDSIVLEDQVDAIATLQPTSPLRLPAWLDRCAQTLSDPRVTSAITVSPVTSKVGTIDGGVFTPGYELETRSQDLVPRYRENGCLYLTRSTTIRAGSVFGSRIGAVVTDHIYGTIDIDDLADLDFARAVMELTE